MITVRFSCKECGLKDELCQVRARESPEEDVTEWMEKFVIPAVSRRHGVLSLLCEAEKVEKLKVPIGPKNDPNPWVGKQTDFIPPKDEDTSDEHDTGGSTGPGGAEG